jgi:Fe-Mn family superoxide dismutase
MKRNQFLQSSVAFLGGSFLLSSFKTKAMRGSFIENSPFVLPSLPYSFEALEPHIDRMTMEIHHDRHHKAYVDNLNKAVIGTPSAALSLEDLLGQISKQPAVIRNNGGGHWNHSFFWKILSPAKGLQASASLLAQINQDFGSLDNLKTEFNKAATTRFGSGWAWLVWSNGKLIISSTTNQDNPLMDIAEVKGTPILALDVWEHAYYLKYQNKRADYINAFWNVVNWDFVSQQFEKIKK